MDSYSAAASWRNILLILLGCAIYAFGIHYFVIPNELMEGGITGIALLINYSLGIPPSITTLVINIPLFFLGWKMFSKRQMLYTIIGTASLSFFLWIMETLISFKWIVPFARETDYFLVTLYAGVTLGTGLGIVFRNGGTTGGSDIIVRIASKLKGWSMGQVTFGFDAIVISSSLLYIPPVKVLYTLVAVFITSRVIDYIMEGAYGAKAFTVITDRAAEIADLIIREMDRSATLLQAKGAYTQKNKTVLYCVVSRNESRRMRDIVKSVDPYAFIIISDVHDVLGEGFKEIKDK